MKILVTGGAGFVGSHVVEACLEAGHEVEVLDNLASGWRANVPRGAPLHEVDIHSRQAERVFEAFQPEVVAHLAAQASVKVSVDDPVFDLEVNGAGTANVAHLAAKHGARKLIYTSTGGALYGDPQVLPANEFHPIRPLSPYGLSKWVGEQYVQLTARSSDLTYTILRPANIYGPRQDPKGEAGVIAIFLGKMLAGEPCEIHGDGEQSKDYVYVGDVARAQVLALTAGDEGIFNIATGKGTSVNKLFRALQLLTGDTTEPSQGPPRPGDVRDIVLDSTLAREVLGWEPSVDLADGLHRTYEAVASAQNEA